MKLIEIEEVSQLSIRSGSVFSRSKKSCRRASFTGVCDHSSRERGTSPFSHANARSTFVPAMLPTACYLIYLYFRVERERERENARAARLKRLSEATT